MPDLSFLRLDETIAAEEGMRWDLGPFKEHVKQQWEMDDPETMKDPWHYIGSVSAERWDDGPKASTLELIEISSDDEMDVETPADITPLSNIETSLDASFKLATASSDQYKSQQQRRKRERRSRSGTNYLFCSSYTFTAHSHLQP